MGTAGPTNTLAKPPVCAVPRSRHDLSKLLTPNEARVGSAKPLPFGPSRRWRIVTGSFADAPCGGGARAHGVRVVAIAAARLRESAAAAESRAERRRGAADDEQKVQTSVDPARALAVWSCALDCTHSLRTGAADPEIEHTKPPVRRDTLSTRSAKAADPESEAQSVLGSTLANLHGLFCRCPLVEARVRTACGRCVSSCRARARASPQRKVALSVGAARPTMKEVEGAHESRGARPSRCVICT